MGLWGMNFVEIHDATERWGWLVFVGALALTVALAISYVGRRGLW